MRHQYYIFYIAMMMVGFSACKQEIDPSTIKGQKVKYIQKEKVFTMEGSEIDLGGDSIAKVYYLIRHAEKDTQKTDPPLNQKGVKRASHLTTLMRKTYLDAVYTTMTSRTVQTIDSITQYKGLSMSIYTPDNIKETFEALQKDNQKNKILVVGHTNTVTPLANFLLGRKHYNAIIQDSVYDDFIIAVKMRNGNSIIYELKY